VTILDPGLPSPAFSMANRSLASISDFIVHHSAGSITQTVQEIDAEHRAIGDAMIGYNWVITPDGSVYSGRPVVYVPAATYGRNAESVNVCLVGQFQEVDLGPNDAPYTGPPSATATSRRCSITATPITRPRAQAITVTCSCRALSTASPRNSSARSNPPSVGTVGIPGPWTARILVGDEPYPQNRLDLLVAQNANYTLWATLLDATTYEPVDLTGASALLSIRTNWNDPSPALLLSSGGSNPGIIFGDPSADPEIPPSSGLVQVLLTAAQTLALPVVYALGTTPPTTRLVYELFVTIGETVTKMLYGTITVLAAVSRPGGTPVIA
jgi:hypothetical protein